MRSLVLLLLCTALGIGVFLLLGESESTVDALESGGQESRSLEFPRAELPALRESTSSRKKESIVPLTPLVQERPTPEGRAGAAKAMDDPALAKRAPTVSFIGQLMLPTGKPVQVSEVHAELRDASGRVRVFDARDTNEIRFSNLRAEPYELQLVVPDCTHRLRVLDLRPDAQAKDNGERSLTERIWLWPENWIPVVLSTPDGRPIDSLAEDLGWAQKNLFFGAFDVQVSADLAGAGEPWPALNPELATFHPPPGMYSTQLLSGVVGSLELHGSLPLWAGMLLHERANQSTVLQVGATELHFRLGLPSMDASMASVTLRVLDAQTKAPVLEVDATLKADTSSHRRNQLSHQAPDADGRLTFGRVIPGQHELTLLREGQIVQRRLTLEAGEHLDLGDILVASGPGLPILVESSPGKGVRATIEIAPYEFGHWVKELYPPNLHRNSNEAGEYVAPLSESPWILRVRVRPVDLGVADAKPSPGQFAYTMERYPQIASRNYLIDPKAVPQEIRILAALEVRLVVEVPSAATVDQWVSFEDEHGLLVAIAPVRESSKMRVSLVPGAYTARRWSGDCQAGTSGLTELGSLPVNVTAEMDSIRCP